VCALSGNAISAVGGGTCSIVATQAGNTFYAAATAGANIPILLPQTITFGAIPDHVYGFPSFPLTATSSAGLPIQFFASPALTCAMVNDLLHINGTGKCSVEAGASATTIYAPASVTQTFTITPASQTISFTAPSGHSVGVTIQLTAYASSNLSVAFVSNTPSVCTVSGINVTTVAAGTCSITATQPGNSNYTAAASVTQSFTVTGSSLEPQTITFSIQAPGNRAVGTSSPLDGVAFASSGLPVTFTSNTPAVCTVSGPILTAIAPGTCTLTASQPGNSVYAPAPSVSVSFAVLSSTQQTQFINFSPLLTDTPLVARSITISATASSGLPVSFSSQTASVCTVSGTTVTLISVGVCTITAAQPGDSKWGPANPVTESFQVLGASIPNISAVKNAASFLSGPVAPDSYVVVFGTNLASVTGDPTTTVSIGSLNASLIYVSPGQVNVLVPEGFYGGGQGTLTVSNSQGASAPFPITFGPIAPGLFTVDAAATIPAAQVIQVAADNTQTVQPVASCTASGCVPVPIVLSASTQSYLILYGTGIRGLGSLNQLSLTIGGMGTQPSYAGPQGSYGGLDQINVLLPSALAGKGNVEVDLNIFGIAANPVQLVFQ
jgi:uncharacterized protein (TIGR03437 family)